VTNRWIKELIFPDRLKLTFYFESGKPVNIAMYIPNGDIDLQVRGEMRVEEIRQRYVMKKSLDKAAIDLLLDEFLEEASNLTYTQSQSQPIQREIS